MDSKLWIVVVAVAVAVTRSLVRNDTKANEKKKNKTAQSIQLHSIIYQQTPTTTHKIITIFLSSSLC